MSGHGAITSQGYKVRPFLREMADYCTLEGDIDHDEPSLDHFRSEPTCLSSDTQMMPLSLMVKVRGQVKVRSVT